MKTSIMYGFRKLNFMHCPPLSSHPRAHTLTQMHSFSHSLSLSHYGEHIHFFRPHKCGSSLSLSKYRHTYNHGERKWNPIEPQFIMFYIYWPMLSFHRVKMSVHTFIFSFYRILLFIFPYIRPTSLIGSKRYLTRITKRLWVRIPVPDTGWIIFTLIYCKKLNCLFEVWK